MTLLPLPIAARAYLAPATSDRNRELSPLFQLHFLPASALSDATSFSGSPNVAISRRLSHPHLPATQLSISPPPRWQPAHPTAES